jgi:branched-subunit amino acid ABC-type transport system permease component
MLLASLGLFVVIQNLISLAFGDDTKSIRRGVVAEGIPVLGARITVLQIEIILVGLGLSVCAAALQGSRMGRFIRAVANDLELSRVVGIDCDAVILRSFALGSSFAGVAAILASLDTDMTPTIGFNALLIGVVAAIAGGIGSGWGAIFGGLLLGFAQNLGVWVLPTRWQDAITFAILLIFLLARPQGFFGGPLRKATA